MKQEHTCPILYACFIKSCNFYIPVVERKKHRSLFFKKERHIMGRLDFAQVLM